MYPVIWRIRVISRPHVEISKLQKFFKQTAIARPGNSIKVSVCRLKGNTVLRYLVGGVQLIDNMQSEITSNNNNFQVTLHQKVYD